MVLGDEMENTGRSCEEFSLLVRDALVSELFVGVGFWSSACERRGGAGSRALGKARWIFATSYPLGGQTLTARRTIDSRLCEPLFRILH